MSGYSGQETQQGVVPGQRTTTEVKLLGLATAKVMLAQAQSDPEGAVAKAFTTLADDGWTLELEKHGRQIIGYDELAFVATGSLESRDPLTRAYGELLCKSMGIDPFDDGR